jgi:hypothetical protein
MKKYEYKSLESTEFIFADKCVVEDNSYVNGRKEFNVRKEYVFYVDDEWLGVAKAVLRIPVTFLVEPPREVG